MESDSVTIQRPPRKFIDKKLTSLFVHPDRDLLLRNPVVHHREKELKDIYKALLLMSTGCKVNLLVKGPPGSGKSHLIDVASRMEFMVNDLVFARVGSMKKKSRKEMYVSLFRAIFQSRQKPAIREIRERVHEYAKEHPVIMVIDDVNGVDRRFKKEFFSIPDDLDVRMACTTALPVDLDRGTGWTRVTLRPYTNKELLEILSLLITENVRNDVMKDNLPLDILVNYVVKEFHGNIIVAIEILKKAICIVENRYLFNGEENPVLIIADIENGIQEYVNDAIKNKDAEHVNDFTSSIVFSIACVQPGQTISTIHESVVKVLDKFFPEKKKPALSTIGNVLRKLKNNNMIMGIKKRPEKHSGVITTWHPIKSKRYLASEFLSSYATMMIREALK